MKWLFKAVLLLIILAVIGVGVLVYYIDAVVRKGVEEGGTYALGVDVTLGGADVDLMGGTCEINGLRVDNPPPFKAPYFLDMDHADMNVSLGSLREDTVRMPKLSLIGLDMYLEKKGESSNYVAILENVKRLERGEKEQAKEPGKKFVIETVTVRDITVHADVEVPLAGTKRVDVTVPEIQLHNVGSDTDSGVLMEELTPLILKAILTTLVEQGAGILPDILVGELSNTLKSLSDLKGLGMQVIGAVVEGQARQIVEQAIEEVGKAIEGTTRDVTKQADKAVEGAADSVGKEAGKVLEGFSDLLDGDKKDDESNPVK